MTRKRYLIIVGILVSVVLLAILFNTLLANHLPTITSLESEPKIILPLGSCQIACNASDPDGDELSYDWSASGGEMNGEGATVTWTAPQSPGSYNVTVTVTDGRGGEVMSQVTITVVRLNAPPYITSLVADADWTTPSSSIYLTCTASDVDKDELSYEWSADGGDISGTGHQVTWTAPEQVGIYNITVVVNDSQGGNDTGSVTLTAATGTPPIIQNLRVTAEHKYLKTTTSGYMVGKEQQYGIECIVSDTNFELFYEWSCNGGELSGEGHMITWTAPDASVNVTVSVIVSDIAGNMVGKSVALSVVPCSVCTFG